MRLNMVVQISSNQNNLFALIKVVILKQQRKKGKKKVNQLYDDLSN